MSVQTGIQTQDVSLEQARAIVTAAIEKSKELDTSMDIAVVDAGAKAIS